MSSSYFTSNQADLVSPAPAFYSQEVSTEYHVQSYEMSLSIRGNTRLDPDHKNHADSTKHKSDLLKICSSLNELHCAKGLSS